MNEELENTEMEIEKECDDCDDCDDDEKEPKQPRYLALYKDPEQCPSICGVLYLTAKTGQALKKALEGIPIENIVMVWKGKQKDIKTKSVITF